MEEMSGRVDKWGKDRAGIESIGKSVTSNPSAVTTAERIGNSWITVVTSPFHSIGISRRVAVPVGLGASFFDSFPALKALG